MTLILPGRLKKNSQILFSNWNSFKRHIRYFTQGRGLEIMDRGGNNPLGCEVTPSLVVQAPPETPSPRPLKCFNNVNSKLKS